MVVVGMAPRGIEPAVPVTGAVGEWVSVHFDKFGRFEGSVIKIAQRSLVMRIAVQSNMRGLPSGTQKIADKIAWAENKDAGAQRLGLLARHYWQGNFRSVRIMTISDIFGALIERRSFKPPLTNDAAYQILLDIGQKLDKDLVREFRFVSQLDQR
jgi:hypothetical protein